MREMRAVLLVACVSLAACGKKPAPAAPQPATAQAPRPTETPAPPRANTEDAAAAAAREAARVQSVLQQRVLFDYDEAEIRADARPVLDEKARILRAAPEIRIRVEGHADERGSTEYNLALGARRASAVVQYLTGFGAAASQFETMSFGEECPLATGHDENAWGQNRRAEFIILRAPQTAVSR